MLANGKKEVELLLHDLPGGSGGAVVTGVGHKQ